MANEEHLTKAGYAISGWNRWRDEHPEIEPDLSGANLSAGLYRKGKLFNANLAGTDFRRSNMREVDLHESNLTGADLSKSDLRQANLAGTNLTKAELAKANLIDADLTGADLTDADLEKASMDRSNLTSVTLAGAKLWKTDLASVTGLTQAQLDVAIGDSTTKLPSGLSRPKTWVERAAEAEQDG